MPLSLITTQAIADLGGLLGGAALDPQRFRPNLLVESFGAVESEWIGSVLRIGGAVMRADQPDERCVVINVDPETGERDPAILRTLAAERSLVHRDLRLDGPAGAGRRRRPGRARTLT